MSGKFDGFSEDDINELRLPKKPQTKPMKVTFSGRGIQRMPDNAEDVKNNFRISTKLEMKSTPRVENSNFENNMPDLSVNSVEESIHFHPLSIKNDLNSEIATIDESILHMEKLDHPDTRKNRPSPFKGISLKDFETQRKLVEEQNKQKKELLYKAIEVHSQKTAAEVKKIEQIKNELAKLDTDLAQDVAILRKQIEAACIHYGNIQKQYDRIESLFLKAKLDLHNASERKELLTEHLSTIIAHNENRKAKKLSELMEKVGLSPSGENDET